MTTRFRAYKLDDIGDSFSYFDGKHFSLIEARLNDANRANVREELKICQVEHIYTLHISSWDNDHCKPNELNEILTDFKPRKIEYPGYDPHTESGIESLRIISEYRLAARSTTAAAPEVKKVAVTPTYIKELEKASEITRRDILYWPKVIYDDNPNDSSTIKLFRTGDFNVLSTGDVETASIAKIIERSKICKEEIDVLILAHHGANNGFTSSSFLDAIKPRIAVCGSNWDNKFEHPKPEIRSLLTRKGVKLYTTKNGDIVIAMENGKAHAIDLMAGNDDVRDVEIFTPKKKKFEALPAYALKDRYRDANTSFVKGLKK